jgi:hypothetical protein
MLEDGILHSHRRENLKSYKSLKNGVFWVVTQCGSCKNRRFGGKEPHGVTSQKTAFFKVACFVSPEYKLEFVVKRTAIPQIFVELIYTGPSATRFSERQ